MAPTSHPCLNFGSLLECEHPGPRGSTHVTFGKEGQKLKKKKNGGWGWGQQTAIGDTRASGESQRLLAIAAWKQKTRGAGSRSVSGVQGAGNRGAARGPQRRLGGSWAAPEVGGLKGPAPSSPGPSCAPDLGGLTPSPCGPRGAPTRRGLQVPGSPEAGAGRSLAQFPGIRRAGKRRRGRSGCGSSGRRAASALAGGAEAGPTWAGALRAREGAGRAGGWRHWELASRLVRRLRLGPGSASGARRARRGGSGAPGGAARSSQTHAEARRSHLRGRCPGAGPRPRHSERGGCLALMAARPGSV